MAKKKKFDMSNTYLAAKYPGLFARLVLAYSGLFSLNSADLKTTSRVRKNTVGKKEKVRHVGHLLGCKIPRVVCLPLGHPEKNIESEKEHGQQKQKSSTRVGRRIRRKKTVSEKEQQLGESNPRPPADTCRI